MSKGTESGRRPANLCVPCGHDLGSLRLFDAHRVGPHDGDRRCLTVEEMTWRGWPLDRHGRWRDPARAQRWASGVSGSVPEGTRAIDRASGLAAAT